MNALPCANHPNVFTDTPCKGCGRPFCASCLTELRGEPLCGWCRDVRIQSMQTRQRTDPKVVVLWARIFDGCVAIGGAGFSFLLAVIYLLPLWAIRSGATTSGGTSATGVTSVLALVCVAAGLVALTIFLPPALMLLPGRGWTWTWQLVALSLAMVGGVITITYFGFLVLAGGIPLLIFWLRPEVRAYLDQPE